ncbi:MAG: hypothetical protein ACYTBP_09415 [Planctomycetota bacterium]|jgi:hypothetical protein
MQAAKNGQQYENDICVPNCKLVGIEEYAARESVSVKMVEDLAKLGVVEIVRSDGEVRVVDVPLSPYGESNIKENSAIATQPVAEEASQSSVDAEEFNKAVVQADDQAGDSSDKPADSGQIAQLIRKMLRKSTKISKADIQAEIGSENSDKVEDKAEIIRQKPAGNPHNSPVARRDLESYLYQSIPMTSSEAVEILNSSTTIADDLVEKAKKLNQVNDDDTVILNLEEKSSASADAKAEEDDDSEPIYTPELQPPRLTGDEIRQPGLQNLDELTIDIEREFEKLIDEIRNFEVLPDPTELIYSAKAHKKPAKPPSKTSNVTCLLKKLFRKSGKVTKEHTPENPDTADLFPAHASSDPGVKLGILTAEAKSKTGWKIFGILSLAGLFVTACLLLWIYMDGKMNLTTTQDRLDQAYSSVQKLYDDSSQAQQNAQQLQQQLENAKAQIAELQNHMLLPNNNFLPGRDIPEQQDQSDIIVELPK